MFFNDSTWFRGHELHFAQVREKGSCQNKIPNWRCKWTVDNTGIVSAFIHFDSPSSSPSSSVSIVGWKVDPCWTVSGWLTGWNVIKRARRFPQMERHTHTNTQIQLSYFVDTLSFVSRHLFSFTGLTGPWPVCFYFVSFFISTRWNSKRDIVKKNSWFCSKMAFLSVFFCFVLLYFK